MNRRLLWALVVLAAGSVARAQELTLDEAIRLALKSNASLRNAALESAKLEDRKASLKTRLLPSAQVYALAAQPVAPFDFTIGRGMLGTDSSGGQLPQSDVKFQNSARPIGLTAVTVTQPLSTIPTIKRGIGLIDIQRKLAAEQTRLERQTVIRDIRQLYYAIQSVESSLRAAREGVRLSQEVVRITAQYAERREVLEVDYLEAQVHLAKATTNVLELENQRETLKSKLNHKIGRDVFTEFAAPEISESSATNLPEAYQDVAQARSRALAQRPEVRQATLRTEQARLEIRNAGAAFDPTIAAQFTGIELLNVTNLLPRQIGVAGVSLSWEPFTWGRKKHELSERRDDIQEAVNKEEEVKGQVLIDVTERFHGVQLAVARLRVAGLSRTVGTESFRIAQKQYEAQYSLLKTVLQAQTSLENANADYQRILGELWTARAEYERALGEDQ